MKQKEYRNNLVAFNLTDSEYKRLLGYMIDGKGDIAARNVNEEAKFIILKQLGCWFRRKGDSLPIPSKLTR